VKDRFSHGRAKTQPCSPSPKFFGLPSVLYPDLSHLSPFFYELKTENRSVLSPFRMTLYVSSSDSPPSDTPPPFFLGSPLQTFRDKQRTCFRPPGCPLHPFPLFSLMRSPHFFGTLFFFHSECVPFSRCAAPPPKPTLFEREPLVRSFGTFRFS